MQSYDIREKIVTQISHRLLWHTEITEITESAFGTGYALYLSPAEFFCPAEIKEITESASGTGCALYLSPAEMKEIKESAFGTGCALIMYRSHRNKGNHRKCLRHRLRTESEAKNFFYFFHFCGTKKTLRDIKICEIREICVTLKSPEDDKISVISFISAGQQKTLRDKKISVISVISV